MYRTFALLPKFYLYYKIYINTKIMYKYLNKCGNTRCKGGYTIALPGAPEAGVTSLGRRPRKL
jgi:hypothetical protein